MPAVVPAEVPWLPRALAPINCEEWRLKSVEARTSTQYMVHGTSEHHLDREKQFVWWKDFPFQGKFALTLL